MKKPLGALVATIGIILLMIIVKANIKKNAEIELPLENEKEPQAILKKPVKELTPAKATPTIPVEISETSAPVEPTPIQSPSYQKVKQSIAAMALEKFLSAYGFEKALEPFIILEDFDLVSIGPKLSLYDGSAVDGKQSLRVFVTEGGNEDTKSIYLVSEIRPSSLAPVNGNTSIQVATDEAGERHYLLRSQKNSQAVLTLLWQKFGEKHTSEEIRIFEKAFR